MPPAISPPLRPGCCSTIPGVGSRAGLSPGPKSYPGNDRTHVMCIVLEQPVRYQRVAGSTFKTMPHGWAQSLVDRMAIVNQGLYNAEPRTSQPTTPTGFRQWCEDVLKPAALL